jgi:hypothetical protein
MNENELGRILGDMYNNAEEGEKVTMIHLFAIKYANEIRESGIAAKDIAEAAKIQPSYGTEISKGVRLSRYVRPI